MCVCMWVCICVFLFMCVATVCPCVCVSMCFCMYVYVYAIVCEIYLLSALPNEQPKSFIPRPSPHTRKGRGHKKYVFLHGEEENRGKQK